MSVTTVLWLVAIAAVLIALFRNREEPWTFRKRLPTIRAFNRDWIPLAIVLSPDLGDEEETQSLKTAVSNAAFYWNTKTGIGLFAEGNLFSDGHVVPIRIAPDPEANEHAIAYTKYSVDSRGALQRAIIYMKPDWKCCTNQILERAMTHELGHCLGLEHDNIHGSVMYGAEMNGVYSISDDAVRFLRKVYGR